MNNRTKLLTESPFKLMLSLSVPAVLGMLVVGLYNLMDAVFAGQMISSTAMGAISISYPFTLINSGVATLIGVGSASVLSRAIGKKDQKTIDSIMGNLIMVVCILSLIITVVGIIFTKQILSVTGAEGEILNSAVRYLRLIFIGSIFVNFFQSANMVMRGEGALKQSMLIVGSGAILNMILAPILISILNKFNMGIEGAAYSTIISQLIQAIVTLMYFIRKSETLKINKIRLDINILPEIFAVGLSAMLMQVMTLLYQTFIFNSASKYGGGTSQILLGAALRVQTFAFIPLWGISQGFQPVAGTNYGAGKYDRVKTMTLVFIASAFVLSLIFYLPVEIAPGAVLSLFIKESNIIQQGVSNFRIMFSTYIFLGIFIMVVTLFQSLGKAKKASIIVLLRQVILFIPLIMILPKWIGVKGIWMAIGLNDGILVLITICMMMFEFKSLSSKTNVKANLDAI
ncbi:MATE family efflux transporter [Clostridium taeniosporum]|uniref:Multidrug export protein MepA n=1 Tax=Clostridium taeniosporum TaxID=394958 RepID=A0A1D7XP11_9CLOT|nr:MATE family efflux transporter [Clostridium taeniosporum]AOR25075.1 MATE family efflux transporter [Clostridium taeniosporum]